MPEQFTCSDCWPRQNDADLIKAHVDAQYLDWGSLAINLNEFASQIVSPDGGTIYFQKGQLSDEVSLFRYDIATRQEREITSHTGSCASLARLRSSPDGRKLAYQLTTGCGFISVPKVFVVDVVTGEKEFVGESNGGTMHWTSTSEQLYFYRDNYLWVAEFPKKGASTTSAPATQPASTGTATAPSP